MIGCVLAVIPPLAYGQEIPGIEGLATERGVFGTQSESVFWAALATIALLAVVAIAGAWLVRRYLGTPFVQSGSTVRVEQRVRISPKTVLFVVVIDGQRHVVTESSERVTFAPATRFAAEKTDG